MTKLLFVLLASFTPWWYVLVATAFLAVISFFQVNSYQADKNKTNTRWKVIGVVLTVLAIVSAVMVSKTSR